MTRFYTESRDLSNGPPPASQNPYVCVFSDFQPELELAMGALACARVRAKTTHVCSCLHASVQPCNLSDRSMGLSCGEAFLLKPNLSEFEAIVGVSKNVQEFRDKGEKLRKKLLLSCLLVTQGKKGMTLFEEKKATSYSASQKDVFDVTGAGDTVVSILSSYVIAGKSISSAVKMSNLAAGLSVQKLGSTSVTQSELLNESKK